MDYARADRADALAAQYVAGTLRGPARRRFEALLPGHPALRAAVQRWQANLLPLSAVLPPQPPPPRVWQGIERRLGFAAAAPQTVGWWRSLALWRGLAVAGLVASVGLSALLSADAPVQAPVVVVLQATEAAGERSAAYVASFSADGRALVTRPVQPVALAAQKALELWAVPPQGAPRSLGLIKADGLSLIRRDQLPELLLKGRAAALAVSVEPPGGSPTGAPTGPVVFAGKLQL